MIPSALKRRAREARTWMLDACFPLWSREGIGSNGLFREALDHNHRPKDTETTRVRVQARQTYVFCEASRLGWEPDRAERLIKMGVSTLKGPARRTDGLVGRRLDSGGSGLSDARADLYDTAFALFALAQAAQLDMPDALPAARSILKSVDAMLTDKTHGGYTETLPREGDQRLQNPHMHLLEACHALHTADPEGGHMKRAEGIVSLFSAKMLDRQTMTLGEYFRPDWSPETGPAHDLIEPGHQFEWVWLLQRHATLSGEELHPAIGHLYDIGLRSLDETGHALTAATREGQVADASRRAWMQTEALKGHLAMLELGHEASGQHAVDSFDILMDEYLTPEGGWIDQFDADGQTPDDAMPASTGYHVVLAFAELLRVTGV